MNFSVGRISVFNCEKNSKLRPIRTGSFKQKKNNKPCCVNNKQNMQTKVRIKGNNQH